MAESTLPTAASARLRATLIGAIAVLLWATLALLTTAAAPVPPFQLVALTFTVAFLLALGKWIFDAMNGVPVLERLRQPAAVWLLGIGGLFGYHFFYFVALGNAPAVDASLIAYLWPLLIVLFSALLPGERLRWFHLLGALAGLAGAALLITRNAGGPAMRPEFVLGYLAAAACAVTWSSYSLLSRRFGRVPTDVVGGFCGATALLGLLCHLAFEETRWPDGPGWLAVLALGLGPVGAAFFVWDYGVKRGDIKALGAFSYAAPLLSTLLLIVFGRAEPGWAIGAACLLIVGGAVLASRDMWRRTP